MNPIKAIRLYFKVKPFLKQFEGQDVGTLITNWKTTLAGIVVLIGMIGPQIGLVTEKQATAISAVAASFGLVLAKDSNVTGGTKKQ